MNKLPTDRAARSKIADKIGREVDAYEVIKKYGLYSVGAIIKPTGIMRDILFQKGVIRKVDQERLMQPSDMKKKKRGRQKKEEVAEIPDAILPDAADVEIAD